MVRRKAQSILEYIIVLSAIIVAVIAAANGPIKNAVTKMYGDSSTVIENNASGFLSKVGK